jgi:MFS transporter, SP family, sugar:H+ symporter
MGFMFDRPADSAGAAWPAIVVGMFVAFGGVLFGYDTGTIGGILAMKYWKEHFSTGYRDAKGDLNVDANQTSEIVSILSAGTFFGALLSAPVADILGRRWGMIFNTGVFTVGVVLQTAATRIPLFVAGRFFAGLGVGLLSATIPLYQSETAPKWIRGAIVGCYQWAITIGLFIAAIVLNATKDLNSKSADPGY